MESSELLIGGDELFHHPAVVKFYRRVMEDWSPDGRKVALLMGCTHHKPYSKSFMHRKVIRLLEKHNLSNHVQQLIVGEPLTVCPREWENVYPAAHYDFPPDRLSLTGRTIFIQRLRAFFDKFASKFEYFVVFAPNHHREIIFNAGEGILSQDKTFVIPYNLYKLPNLYLTLKNIVRNL
jgi:archaeosine synthase